MNDATYSESEQSRAQSAELWRFYKGVLLITLLFYIGAYWSTLFKIVSIWWHSRTFNHGFIIIPISLYLIWQRKQEILVTIPKPELPGTLILTGLILIWLIAYIADVQVIQQFAVVVMIPILAYVLLGRDTVKVIMFPLAFLFFAVPFGEFMVPILQDVTAYFTVQALRVSGIPVYIEGRYISIPSGNFRVAEACSGIRYLIASIALGTLYAYLTYYSVWRRLIFIALSIIIPIAANSVRAYGIVLLAHLSDYELATGFDHLIYGWLFFGAVMLLLFWIGSYFRDQKPESAKKYTRNDNSTIELNKKQTVNALLATIFLLISGPLLAAWLAASPENSHIAKLPNAVKQWSGPSSGTDMLHPNYIGATAQLVGEYSQNGKKLLLYLVYFAEQKQGAELVNSENQLYDPEIWRRISESKVTIPLQTNKKFQPVVTRISSEQEQLLLWYWYEINSLSTSDPITVKIAEIKAKLTRSNQASSVVIVSTPIIDSENMANDTIFEFVDHMMPGIKQAVFVDE